MSCIRQLEEKVVPSEVVLMKWNDRMDLLALANNKGEVSLHRLTWQRVWCLPVNKENIMVVDMTWRPDGKILAIAYNTGDVILVEVEKKNILREIKIEEPISCIIWQQDKNLIQSKKPSNENEPYSKGESIKSNYLPNLPPLSSEFASATNIISENLVDLHFIRNQNNLSLLLIGTKNGKLLISISGLFPFALLDISNIIEKCSILNAFMSENFNVLYVTVYTENNDVKVSIFDTSILTIHREGLFTMACKHNSLVSLQAYLNASISSITEAWESILLEMDTKLEKYASTVPEGTVTADCLELLMFGILSDEMEEFLMQDLTDKGLKKMGHTIELSYTNIQKLILKNLHEVGQHITYYLSELRGISRFTYANKNMGLDERTLTEAIKASGAFLVKCVELQQVINNSLNNYRAFFRWLYVVILRLMGEQIPQDVPKMTQQDITDITEFLQNFDNLGNDSSGEKGKFKLERLGQYLVDAPLTITVRQKENMWSKFLQDNEDIIDNDMIFKHYESMSLIQQHKHLTDALERVFIYPNDFISDNIKLREYFIVSNTIDTNNLFLSQMNFNDDLTFLAFYDKKLQNNEIYVLEINNEHLTAKGVIVTSSRVPGISESVGCSILDMKFYSPIYFSFLLDDSNSNYQYLCQTPMEDIHSVLSETTLSTTHSFQLTSSLNAAEVAGNIVKQIEGMPAFKFEVSSNRHVCVVVSENRRKVQLFEMEAEEEDDETEESYFTANTSRDTDATVFQSSISSE